jgi:hypothetical protein
MNMELRKFSPLHIFMEGEAQERQIKVDAGLSPNALYTEGGLSTVLEVQRTRLLTIAKVTGVLTLPPAAILITSQAVEAISNIPR